MTMIMQESSKAASLSARALYSSVAQFSSQISFAGTTPFKDSSSRVEGHLHDFRLSIGGTLLQALFFLVLEGRGFLRILIVGAVPQSSGSARAWRLSAVGTRSGQSNGRHVAVADRL
jgi:hypothetical protein